MRFAPLRFKLKTIKLRIFVKKFYETNPDGRLAKSIL